MTPIDKLNAAAARLVQEANAQHGPLAVRLRETAGTIRSCVATIRTALEGNDRHPRHPKFVLVVGDEDPPPTATNEI